MLLVPAAQERADDVRERSAHRRSEGECPILAEALARVGLGQVAAVDPEEMVRFGYLPQACRTPRMPERHQPALPIRPPPGPSLPAAGPAQAPRAQERPHAAG